MVAARVLVAVSAQSVAAVQDELTLPQLRVLVMVASRREMNLGAVAEGLGVHPSNATRAVDRLVVAGLLGWLVLELIWRWRVTARYRARHVPSTASPY